MRYSFTTVDGGHGTWPLPDGELQSLKHRLLFDKDLVSKDEYAMLASVLTAYSELVSMTSQRRNVVCIAVRTENNKLHKRKMEEKRAMQKDLPIGNHKELLKEVPS